MSKSEAQSLWAVLGAARIGEAPEWLGVCRETDDSEVAVSDVLAHAERSEDEFVVLTAVDLTGDPEDIKGAFSRLFQDANIPVERWKLFFSRFKTVIFLARDEAGVREVTLASVTKS